MKVNLKESRLTKEQKVNIMTLIKEYSNAFSYQDEKETYLPVEVHLKLCDEVPFLVCLFAIKEEQKPVIEKEINYLEILGMGKKGLTGYNSLVLLKNKSNKTLQSM